MAVQLLISPPAGGKTQATIEQVLAVYAKRPLADVWVVLPDRLQTAYYRNRLAAAGGALGVQVGTFGSLYQELLERCSKPVAIAPDPIVYRLIQAAIEDVFGAGRLNYYRQLQTMPGFTLALRELFAEFKRALLDPNSLLVDAQGREPAFMELAEIYNRYQVRLQDLNWADTEGISWLAVEAMQLDSSLGSDLQLVVIDGFDSFTTTQLRALELLAGRAEAITITLPGSLDMSRSVHQRFAHPLEVLQSVLQAQVMPLQTGSFLPDALARLEQSLFETDTTRMEDAGQIAMIEARSPYEEAREALRWLKARLIRDGLKAVECALVVPNIETYRPYLRMAASEFGLPLRFTLEESLTAASPVALLIDLLELPRRNYPRRLLLDTLRSPYLDLGWLGLDSHQVGALEIASLYGQVVEGLAQWIETLEDLAAAQPDKLLEPEDADGSHPALPVGEQAARLQASLAGFVSRLAPPLEKLSIPEWVTWVEELLDDLGFMQDSELERDMAAMIGLRQTLQALGMSSVIGGNRNVDYGSFLAELLGAFQGARYSSLPARIRPAQSEILVLRMLEARGVRFKAIAILGLSEGIYPQIERVDPFFSEPDRRRFGLEPRLDRKQAGVFYQALTRTDRFLLLTRPYLSDDGESWEPSPYWIDVLKLLPATVLQVIRADDHRPLEEAASAQELLFWAVQSADQFGQGLPARYHNLQKRWQHLGHAKKVLQARLDRNADSPYEGMPSELRDELGTYFGSQHIWSASRLETYGSCPFRFYVEVVLGLQASQPPQPGLDAGQLGSLLHKILENAYRQAADPSDPDSVLAGLAEVASTAFQEAPKTFGFRPSTLWEVQQEQWLASLEKTIRQNAAYDPAWSPEAYEARFGLMDRPALEIQTDTGPVRLRGVIDRIDRGPNGDLRVVDYKTGGSHLTPADLIEGLRLQLPIYALAAERALSLGQVSEGLYWKILKAEPGSLKLAAFGFEDAYAGVEGACNLAEDYVGKFVAGIRQAEYPPIAPKGGCPSYCAAAAWCWRYDPSAY